ncbi:MAG: hypothetical protein KDH88_17000 [Chromatiales bacterium]|nr:hypothetical protein [Chromatiales bacterium]
MYLAWIDFVLASTALAVALWLFARKRRSERLHLHCVRLCHRIADELARKQAPELVTDRVFRVVMEHTGACIGVLLFRDATDAPLRVLRVSGLPDNVLVQDRLLEVGEAGWNCGAVKASGRMELLHKGLREALYERTGIRLDRRQNMICIPVTGVGQLEGLLQLVSAPGEQFTQQHMVDLEGVGYYLDAAIHNATLIETIRRQRDAAQALYGIGLSISGFLDLDSVLVESVRQAKTLLNSDLAWFLDCSHGDLRRLVIRQCAGELPAGFALGDRLPLVGEIAALVEPNLPDDRPSYLVLGDLAANRAARVAGEGRLFCDADVEGRFLAAGLRSALFVRVGDREEAEGLLCGFSRTADYFDDFAVDLLQRLANQVLIALKTAALHAGQRRMAVVEERQRLSNELHDQMAQIINGLSLELHALGRMTRGLDSDGKLDERFAAIGARLDDAKASIRSAIFELRLPEGRDLWRNLGEFLGRFGHWHGLRLRSELPAEPLPLPMDAQLEVLRIVQEALWNVRKHGSESSARLRAYSVPERQTVCIEISNRAQALEPSRFDMGQGIATMRSRAARLGGSLDVTITSKGDVQVVLEWSPHGDAVQPRGQNWHDRRIDGGRSPDFSPGHTPSP